MRGLLVLTVAVLSWCSSANSEALKYLLPTSVRPHHYDIYLGVDINPANHFPFFGLVEIQLKALSPTNTIVLHAQNYKIQEDRIVLKGDNAPRVTKVQLDTEDTNFLTLDLSDDLSLGTNYTLSIPFSGNYKADLEGVYVSSYVDQKTTKTEYLITTQFEAISARKGFPCFDEPMYKATFSINLGHSDQFSAVSNMPAMKTDKTNLIEEYWPWGTMAEKFKLNQSSFTWDQFQKSVPMSTYLVAFVISKFSHMDSPQGISKTNFSIWARKDAVDAGQTSYAAMTGPKVLTFFEDWFNISFPLPKQDMFAIPDFSAGAMENWGLITYRETALLYHKEQSSFQNKQRVFEVIAHELAHQWFGNLVTMKWWSDLWLNEGFATYMASIAMQALEPEWKGEEGEAVESMMSVLALDSLESSHPVSAPIDNPKRISEIFDDISYRKGCLLIRMMYMFLGDSVFKKAINNYLFKYSYSNAEQDDLWRELTLVGQHYAAIDRNVTVKGVMDTWTTQTGYPLLTVRRDYDDGSLTVLQKRYLALGAKAESRVSWWVPLNVLCESEVGRAAAEPVQWLSDREGTDMEQKYEHGASNDQWVLFNKNMIAPYRVNYDTRNWQLLVKTLNSNEYRNIPTLSRVQLLADSFALVWSNELDYNITLELANYLRQEEEYLPLDTGLSGLNKIDNVLKRKPEYGAFQKFMRGLITPAYERSGGLYAKRIINDQDLISVKLQVLTSRMACYVKVPGCEDSAMELFKSWMDSDRPDEENPIPLDLRRTVYCVAAARGSVAEWRFLLERKRRSNVASVRNSLLAGMACTREVWILKQFLEWAIEDDSEIRRQDSGMVISSVMRSPVGYYVAKEFLTTRIQDIHKAFGGQSKRIGHMVKSMIEQFTTEQELDEFLMWKERNSKYLSDSMLAVEQGIEKARVNIGWTRHNKDVLIKKLREIGK